MQKNPERREEPLQDLGKTLEGITRGGDPGLKQALAGIMNYLPDSKKSGKDIPNKGDLQSAMIKRIDADTSALDIAKNPQVSAIKAEMMSRINAESDPSKLLENYAQMRGMLDGAIGANEGAQKKGSDIVQGQGRDKQIQNDLAQLDFVQLGQKFRDSLDQANREKSLNQSRVTADAKARSYTEARFDQSQAPEELTKRLNLNT